MARKRNKQYGRFEGLFGPTTILHTLQAVHYGIYSYIIILGNSTTINIKRVALITSTLDRTLLTTRCGV